MSVVVPLPTVRRDSLKFEEQLNPLKYVCATSQSTCTNENFASLIVPGDVLQVNGNDHLSQIGAAGGFMGHVMVVMARPRCVYIHSKEGSTLRDVWPISYRGPLWRIPTMESTRFKVGLHLTDLLLHIDATGCFILRGEVSHDGELAVISEGERVVVWQSPSQLRCSLRLDLMSQVFTEMFLEGESWSMTTALRALFMSAKVFRNLKAEEDLESIQLCWDSAPICTSVAVVFWQRYLCKVAHSLSADVNTELAFILKWMPLKGDRTLPGQLSDAMRECGWHCVEKALASI